MSKSIKVDIWSEISCPWCYVGKHRLQAALATFAAETDRPAVSIEFHSFELAPEIPENYSQNHRTYLSEHYGWTEAQATAANRQLEAAGAPLGIKFDFENRKVVNTHRAHELLHHAKRHGMQAEMKEVLQRAHFCEQADLSRVEILAGLAETIGLNYQAAAEAVLSGAYVQAVDDDIEMGRRLGVTGVPFFVLAQKYRLSGAQDPSTLLQALEAVADDITEVEPANSETGSPACG
ncbi:DsbA family oxidoreductase [Aquamicrobium terrae]|uniref:DsbA family dithiol-disulfide isomerase n=1 Tax=Aquamicrobium terrae TaxID=1324945 RepID=A0ABV2N2W6_9HYPH